MPPPGGPVGKGKPPRGGIPCRRHRGASLAKRAILILSLTLDCLPIHCRHAILLGAPGEAWHVDLFGLALDLPKLLEGTHLLSLEDERGLQLAGYVRLKPGASRFFAHLEGYERLRQRKSASTTGAC